jgi:thiamine phosphate synthase YjbQ (UPF0047 family)
MDHLSSILPKVLRKRGLHGHANAAFVTMKAQQWITQAIPEITDLVSVPSVAEGTLRIVCTHSVAVQEVSNVKEDLLRYLDSACPQAVKNIRIERG